MLIPSIDLMGGKIVQLGHGGHTHGQAKEVDIAEFGPWIKKFEKFPLIHVVDLDAVMRTGSNKELLAQLTKRLPCQVGGGASTVEKVRELLSAGAKRVVVGSALVSNEKIDTDFAKKVSGEIGADKLVFAVDTKQGLLALGGWKKTVSITAEDAIRALEPYCKAFMHTHVDDSAMGTMGGGFPMAEARDLCKVTKRHLMVAGGIRSMDEVAELDALGIDAIVGMAIYSGALAV
jgi:phosphoribosylformimino-5-aminoimidazole carboxamide ribotide isomerase